MNTHHRKTDAQVVEQGIGAIQMSALAALGQTIAGPTVNTGTVKDSDTAASAGTAVNVVPSSDGFHAYLVSTTAGNALYTAKIGSTGPTVVVNDSDSPGGVQLYFDEDATATDSRFLCVSPTGADLFVPASNGALIRVKHTATAASAGVAVYGDDDAANAHERLLFVSPTNANGSYTTDDSVSLQIGPSLAEVQAISTKLDALLAALKATTAPLMASA